MRECDSCGQTYQAQRPTSRFCSSKCRSRNAGAPPPVTVRPVDARAVGGVVEAATAELAALGMLSTSIGEAALVFATLLADSAEPASGRAAAGRVFSDFMAQARREGQPQVGDFVDRLRAQRDRKRLDLLVERDGGGAAVES